MTINSAARRAHRVGCRAATRLRTPRPRSKRKTPGLAIHQAGSARLGTALLAARAGNGLTSSAVAEVYAASQHLRDVADRSATRSSDSSPRIFATLSKRWSWRRSNIPGRSSIAISTRYVWRSAAVTGEKVERLAGTLHRLGANRRNRQGLGCARRHGGLEDVLKGLLLIDICVANRQASARQHVLQSVPELCQRNL